MPMNTTLTKLAIGIALIVLLSVGGWFSSHQSGVYREIRLPDEPLSSIPMELGNWQAKDIPFEDRLFRGVGAKEVVSRSYTNCATGRELTLHAALFNTFWRIAPHPPTRCYPSNGWTTLGKEEFKLNALDGTSATARLASFEKDGNRILVLYWFQFGDYVIYDTPGLNKARWEYRDDKTWPPLVKMMIELSANKPEQARKQLKEFADALHEVTKKYK